MEKEGKLMRTCLLSAMLLLFCASQSRADLIVNGSFESFSLSGPPSDTTFTGYIEFVGPPNTVVNTEITGWILIGQSGANPNNVDLTDNSLYPAFAGSKALDMEGAGGASGVIRQSFATTPGGTYHLSFAYGNNPGGGDATMNVLVTGTGTLLNTNVSHNTSTFVNMDYKLFSQDFTAHSATTTLQFSAVTNSGYGIAVDAVSVVATPLPVTGMILPQLAFGGGWYTALYFTNTTTAPISFTVSFTGNDGNPLTIPALGGSSVTVNLAARGAALIEAPNVGSLVQGYVTATLPPGVTGYGVFRQSVTGVPDQEAVVPLSGNTATTSTLLFDDTKYVTGVAVVNLASVNNTITATARDNQGNTLGTGTIPLAPNAKTALVLRNIPGLARIAGAIGSVDFTATIGNVAALGLRFNGSAFTAIPTSDR